MVRNRQVNEQLRVQSREDILAAARQIFAQQGYFNCKVSDIARMARMSQGNVYWYFSGKEEILKALLGEVFDGLETILAGIEKSTLRAQEKIDMLVTQFLGFARENGEYMTIYLSLLGHGGAQFLAGLGFDTLQIGMGYHRHLAAVLAEAQQEGLASGADPNVLAAFFFSLFNGLLLTYGTDWAALLPEEDIRKAVWRLFGGDQPGSPFAKTGGAR